jgi:hypothetical protein
MRAIATKKTTAPSTQSQPGDQPILQGGKTENNTRNRQHSTVARHGAAALLYQSSHEGDIGLQCFRLIAHPRPPLLD